MITWPKGPTNERFYRTIKKHAKVVLNGTVLAIDPSSGSDESMPGFAVFKQGELVMSGTIKLPHIELHGRLYALYDKIQALLGSPPDLLVVEDIAGQIHKYLHYAVGVSIAAARSPLSLRIGLPVWKAVAKADPKYVKSDVNDAIKMGEAVVLLARGA